MEFRAAGACTFSAHFQGDPSPTPVLCAYQVTEQRVDVVLRFEGTPERSLTGTWSRARVILTDAPGDEWVFLR